MKTAHVLFALLALVACRERNASGDTERAGAAAADTATARNPAEDELGPFQVGGRSFTVKFEKQRRGSDEHVVRMQIVDQHGNSHIEERFDSAAVAADALDYTVTIGATPVHGERGQGLLLWYEYTPSAPLSGYQVKVFALDGDRLIALSPALSVYGSFHELPRDSAAQAERLLPGDVMNVEVWHTWFGVVVPFFVDLGGCTPIAGSSCVRPQPARRHAASGLAIFDVVGQPQPVTSDTSVVLYDAPEGKRTSKVAVKPSSRVELVEAAAVPVLGGEEGLLDVTVQREWLHVKIDGRSGWIHGQESYGAIGLRAAN